MIAIISVDFTTTLLISKGLTVKHQADFQDTWGITLEVVAIFLPLR